MSKFLNLATKAHWLRRGFIQAKHGNYLYPLLPLPKVGKVGDEQVTRESCLKWAGGVIRTVKACFLKFPR